MYLIKQYLITTQTIRKIIKYILLSNENAYQIGLEISLLYYFIYDEKKHNKSNQSNNINTIVQEFLVNSNNLIDNNTKLILLDYLTIKINYNNFFYKFNKKLFTIDKERLSSFFRGYYLNALDLYATNIVFDYNNNLDCYNKLDLNTFESYYIVLYDFHSIYLDYIYRQLLKNSNYVSYKIKFLISTEYDKYSISDITDDTNFKLVFLHKKKYYYNSLKYFLTYLFYNIKSLDNLIHEDEIKLFKLYSQL